MPDEFIIGESTNVTYYWNQTLQNHSLTNNTVEQWELVIPPFWRQLLWILLFGIMVVVATTGNLIVVWLVLSNKRMRTVTNYFLVNLSIADAMVSSLNVPFNFIYMLYSDWFFGYTYCKISQFISVISICASVYTLMAISIDRYMAIMYPLRPRMGRRTTIGIASVIWLASSVIATPNLFLYTLETDEERRICYAQQAELDYWYNVVFMFLTYFLPIVPMSYNYIRIGIELWGSKTIGECTQRQLENIKSKRRVVKMMIIVVTTFMLCWLPFHTYFIVNSHFPSLAYSPYIREIFLAIYWLAMSNAMYNPFIYCWLNMRFRRGFKEFFSWCPGIEKPPALLERRDPVTLQTSLTTADAKFRILRNGTVHIPLHKAGEEITLSGEMSSMKDYQNVTQRANKRRRSGQQDAMKQGTVS